jgi:hypothetical protein
MKKRTFLLIALVTCICGMVLFAYCNQWFILIKKSPAYTQQYTHAEDGAHSTKTVTFSYWRAGEWHKEQLDIPWQERTQDALTYLVNRYLEYLYEESILTQKITVQTLLFSITELECYLSLDKNPLNPEWSIQQKWYCIEGLLKTLREHGLTSPKVYFLVDHKPLVDDHLDFAAAWPLEGF